MPQKVPDPRSKQGVSQPFRTVLAITFLGLLAHLSTLAEIERWANIHLTPLKQFLRLRYRKGQECVTSDTTLARMTARSVKKGGR